LIDAVIKALQGGNGFSGQCQSEDELQDRLAAAGVVYDPADLPAALTRLQDSGRVFRHELRPTQQQPHPPGPFVFRSTGGFNSWESFSRTDALAADIVASIARRSDRFELHRLCLMQQMQPAAKGDLPASKQAIVIRHGFRFLRPGPRR
jgi:hypothetical protein